MGAARWFRLSIGLVLLVGALWVLFSRLDAIWNGHPAYPTTLLVTAGVGLTLIGFAMYPWQPDPEPNGPPWEAEEAAAAARTAPRIRHGWRTAGRVVVAVLVVVLIGALAWLRPYPAGTEAMAALQSDELVTVTDATTTIELRPVTPASPTAGLVFSPGALVDARAYTDLLRSVAAAGYLVVILKVPFGVAITQLGQSAGPIADHPEISRWAVGGHSLGGVAASSFAADNPDTVSGLLLWASYPNGDLSALTSLQVESIYGSNDPLATPADIEKSKANLPPDATFTEIDGGIHAYFADYGEQSGDGQAGVDRATASAQIVSATTTFLARVAAGGSAG
jgi:hypothetical protein